MSNVQAIVQSIRAQLPEHFSPQIGCILGSGLGELAEQVEVVARIPFANIPYFPQSSVVGHAGMLVIGQFAGQSVMMMQGRFHYYEGHSMQTVALPIYVMQQLGVHTLIVTNAAGGMNSQFRPGDLMLITDHLNMTGDSPLIGINDDSLGPRFPDMSQAYDLSLRDMVKQLALEMLSGQAVNLREGVYAGITGPSYMTPAELKMLARLGADAVGMSTVAEVIAARHAGIRVIGISCITDMAIGEQLEPLTHEQVVAVANRTKPIFSSLVRAIVERLSFD
jgi:purine-nucleoside phosphorylase